MKKLIIIRHAKATQNPMPDIERFITEKGIKRTINFSEKLKENKIYPDLILSSPAVRAVQTAEIIAKIFKYPNKNINKIKSFYFEPDEIVLNEIYSLPENVSNVFIVGHNPLWTQLANYFSNKNILHLKTSGICGIKFYTNNWSKIETSTKKDIVLIN